MPRSAARLPDDRLHNAVLPPRQALLAWYDRNRRRLPWRALPGETPDAYAVWLSEIMLQQTTVATVIPRYQKFLTRWPTVLVLAAAPLVDVVGEWAGLGYYARARNLHACAQAVVDRFGGVFPDNQDDLASLPGIGAYSSASIAALSPGASSRSRYATKRSFSPCSPFGGFGFGSLMGRRPRPGACRPPCPP